LQRHKSDEAALTIHALTNDFKKVLHTDNDRPAAAKPKIFLSATGS
jgi:hypothetical protein